MKLINRNIFVLYYMIYSCFYISYFWFNAAWAPAVGAAASLLFGTIAVISLRKGPIRGWSLVYLLVSALIGCLGLFSLVHVIPVEVLIFGNSVGMLWLIIAHIRESRKWRVPALVIYTVAFLASLPLPGIYTAIPADPSAFSVTGKESVMLAPNISYRNSYAGDEAFRLWNVAMAKGEIQGISGNTLNNVNDLSEEDFDELYELPFNVPAAFYQSQGADSSVDPHALIKALAHWNELSNNDIAQGQTIMAIGGITSEGDITMVEDIQAYVQAAIQAKPKVLFVPTEAYLQVKDLSKGLLVVPVSHFEEVLYFLSEPVEFWPLRNFGLFCH